MFTVLRLSGYATYGVVLVSTNLPALTLISALVYLWALFDLHIKRVSDGSDAGAFGASLHELVVDFLLHEGSRSSRTHLALVEEERSVRRLHRLVH